MRPTSGQAKVLEHLESRWHTLESGGSRLVVIHGPQGTGKTAIVHHFYRSLVAQQDGDHPSFWPAEIAAEDAPRRLTRKAVRPCAPADPFGTLSFGWLGRTCSAVEDGHAAAPDLDQLVSEQVAQVLYMDFNQADHDLGEEALAGLLAFVSAGGGALAFGAAGAVAGTLTSWAMFGQRLANLVRLALSEEAQLKAAAERIGRLPWAPVLTRNHVTMARLERLAQLGMPTVLALEDVHLADEATVGLCRAVVASEAAKVLILATADSGTLITQMEEGHGFGSLLSDDLGGRYRPMTTSLEDPLAAELFRIASAVLPDGDRHVLDRVVEVGGTSIEDTVEASQRVAAGVSPADQGAESQVDRRWLELDDEARRYLACMAALQGEVWYADQPLDQLDVLPREIQEESQHRALAHGLLVTLDRWRLAFTEPAWYCLAKDKAPMLVPATQLNSARRDLFHSISADKADNLFWDDLPLPVQATVLRTHCSLYPEPTGEQLAEIGAELIDSLDRLAGLEAIVDRTLEATRIVARAVDLVELTRRKGGFVEAQAALQMQARYAYLPISGREMADQFDDAQVFNENMKDRYGPGSTEHLVARWNTACMHAFVYDFVSARAIGGEIIKAAGSTIRPLTLLDWRVDHANWTGDSGWTRQAARLFQELVPTLQSRRGPDHPDTLVARHHLAWWLSKEGHASEAVGQYQALLDDMLRVLGPYDPRTLAVRHHLASSLVGERRIRESIEQLEALVPDMVRVLGPDNTNTLTCRHELAYSLGQLGQVGEAVEQLNSLLDDVLQVLGRDSPHTLAVRRDLARFVGEQGQVDEAIEQFEALLVDSLRVLGSDHATTFAARKGLVRVLSEAGRRSVACEQLAVLLSDMLKVLGRDHADTIATQRSLEALCGGGPAHA